MSGFQGKAGRRHGRGERAGDLEESSRARLEEFCDGEEDLWKVGSDESLTRLSPEKVEQVCQEGSRGLGAAN